MPPRRCTPRSPGVSKQIQLLEAEIGFPVFQRKRNRVTGLTEPGREVIEIAQRIMGDVENLRTLRDDYLDREKGTLTIATTHTYARYVLPWVIERFIKRYPDVHLGLQQGNPTQICEAVEAEQADIAIGTEAIRAVSESGAAALFPDCAQRNRKKRPSCPACEKTDAAGNRPLSDQLRMTAHAAGAGKSWKRSVKEGIEPNVRFGAVDADVCKTYVEMGLGIAILATVAVDPVHDINLTCA